MVGVLAGEWRVGCASLEGDRLVLVALVTEPMEIYQKALRNCCARKAAEAWSTPVAREAAEVWTKWRHSFCEIGSFCAPGSRNSPLDFLFS